MSEITEAMVDEAYEFCAHDLTRGDIRGIIAAALSAVSKWLPISTLTPEHLEVILGSAPRQLVGEGRLCRPEDVQKFGKFPGWNTYYFGEPTHWTPLPPPPKGEA